MSLVYELGQVVSWRLDLGANLATAPTATVTRPDGSSVAATVAALGSGVYTASTPAVVLGRFWVVWVGDTAAGLPLSDSATVSLPALRLLTVEDLADHMRTAIAPADRAHAQSACDDASACVRNYCDATLLEAATGDKLRAAQTVAKRVAARFFANPLDRSSYAGPNGLAYSPGVSAQILTGDERAQLAPLTLPGMA